VFDQAALIRGERGAWDRFIEGFTGVIHAAIRTLPGLGTVGRGETADLTQDVFTALVRENYRLLRQYDPDRAAPSTWLSIVARSVARDRMRRKAVPVQPLEDTAEALLAAPVEEPPDAVTIPAGLLSPRQELILSMLYDRDMDPAEVAAFLGIEAQTVRSQHHKALTKLRRFFADSSTTDGDEPPASALSSGRRT
jgi:RNA polymerase sigma-70 factor (ECF subfamily)